MNSCSFLTCIVCFLLLYSSVETKGRNRLRHSQRRLRRLCSMKNSSKSSRGNSAVELHAYFDIRPVKKAFACLKVSTCEGRPVCFVTSYPGLETKSVNDSTIIWQDLISYIQRDRKIEPLYDSFTKGWNGDRYKILSKYQPAIYRMCRDAVIYRFVANDIMKKNSSQVRHGNSSSSPLQSNNNTAKITKKDSPKLDPVSLCPLFARRKAFRRRDSKRSKRVGRSRHNVTTDNFMFCHGLNCPCVRICVGQGRKQATFTDCSTFRIICTFNCRQDAGVFSSFSKPKSSKKRSKGSRKSKKRAKPRKKSKSNRGNRKRNGKRGK